MRHSSRFPLAGLMQTSAVIASVVSRHRKPGGAAAAARNAEGGARSRAEWNALTS